MAPEVDLSLLRSRLTAAGQQHVLRFLDELAVCQRRRLLEQLSALDWDLLTRLVESHVRNKPSVSLPADLKPIRPYPRNPGPEHAALYAEAEQRGWRLLREGRAAALLVAGGQGTRLGYPGPKGEFPITPVRRKPLFQVFAEQIRAFSRESGRRIPWYIMTSDATDRPTRTFFERNGYFGCDPADVFFFRQGLMPAFSTAGELLLADRDSLALSPDGHGGCISALRRSGALADMSARGIEHIAYFQVDNPLVHCIDPLFLGLHELAGSDMSSKAIPKSHPLEKVGNFVLADGVLHVIEYSDLPEGLAYAVDENSRLRFNAGSIAIHAIRVSFFARLAEAGGAQLPWHRAEKKVAHVDASGRLVNPDRPNAVKLEQFVFDAIPLARNPIVYMTDRAEEFSPVKNAAGDDSPETCRRDQIRRAARWLRSAGVRVPGDDGEPEAVLEISPLFAATPAQLRARPLPAEVERGTELYLE